MGVGRLLAVAPMRYMGDRSYAYYLWHWPVLIIAAEYIGHDLSLGVNLLLLLAAFLLSIITFRFFEDPIRRAPWTNLRSAMLVPSSVAAVVVAAIVSLMLINSKVAPLERASANAQSVTLQSGQQVARSRTLPAVIAAVKAARRGAKIPSVLTPPVSKLLDDHYDFPSGCVPTSEQTTSTVCRLGSASSAKSIVVFGDSHAMMWMPTLLAMAQRDDWAVIPLVKSACTPGEWLGKGYAGTPQDDISRCHAWYQWAVGQAKALHPDVTLMTGCCGGLPASGDSTTADERRGFSALGTAMKRFSTSVVLVADNDGVSKQPADCLLARGATMRTCTTKWPAARFGFIDGLAKLAKARGFGLLRREAGSAISVSVRWSSATRSCTATAGISPRHMPSRSPPCSGARFGVASLTFVRADGR